MRPSFLLSFGLVVSVALVTGCGGGGDESGPWNGEEVRWPLFGGTTPDAVLSATFGPRVDPNGKYELHRGVDVPTDVGTKVHAIANGRVFNILDHDIDTQGQRVELCHAEAGAEAPPDDCSGAAYFGFYSHLSRLDVKLGDVIPAGGTLGLSGVGPNGFPHLHFEIRLGKGEKGDVVHPLTVLPHEDKGAPGVEVTSVDAADPLHPIVTVTATAPAPELDLTAVKVRVLGAGGKVVDERNFSIAEWNTVRTASGGDAEANTAEIDGLRLEPEEYSQGVDAYRIHITFLALTGPADAKDLQIEATATDASDTTSTATYP